MNVPSHKPVENIETKTILSKLKERDNFFGISYNMNLYRGCQHACIYCDTRSECYGIGDISKIKVKNNAIDLLRKELKSKRKKRQTIGTGSMNDPYMPLEKQFGLTRKALEQIASNRFPVHIITKSNLVGRDIDIIKDISSVYSAVSFSITTSSDSLSKLIEPNAPTSSKRFEALAQLSKHGIYAGVTMMPILPFINDTMDNVNELLKMAKDSGAQYVIPMFGLTLRVGSREYFYNSLDNSFPNLKKKYMTEFGQCYECYSPRYRQLIDSFNQQTCKLSLPSRMRFFTPTEPKQLELF